MLVTRIIPCLQLINQSLVKTVKFGKYNYIGDYINTVRIFNELEVDELCILDIRASLDRRKPNLDILAHIADECFMPLSYGGGIHDFELAKKILSIGFEKLVINTAAYRTPLFISKLSDFFGSQAIIASIDVKRNIWGTCKVFVNNGTEEINQSPITWAQRMEKAGAGEILLTSMDRDGTWSGFDTEIIQKVARAVSIPVIANGGAGSLEHITQAVKHGASAIALGSMVVYQKKGMGVLINFPNRQELEKILQID